MTTQEIRFDVTETLSLIAEAANFWQSLDVKKLEAMSNPDLDQLGEVKKEIKAA